jgi:hypothetical protein
MASIGITLGDTEFRLAGNKVGAVDSEPSVVTVSFRAGSSTRLSAVFGRLRSLTGGREFESLRARQIV